MATTEPVTREEFNLLRSDVTKLTEDVGDLKNGMSLMKDHQLQMCTDLRSDMAEIKNLLNRRNGDSS